MCRTSPPGLILLTVVRYDCHDDMQANALDVRFDKAYVAVLTELVMEVVGRKREGGGGGGG